ncbi:MAG TPA: M48 family metalloprotease [Geobacteraceae bacterium]|nr:M48 family metalloprotease [Geobacteraceae bacterium]
MKKILFAIGVTFFLGGCNLKEIRMEHFDMLAKSVTAASTAARPISDSEEYYVGRAVAARILGRYPVSGNRELTGYVNMVGQAVSANSEKPNTFGGYHFAVLDSAEVNAFACPGGTILVTVGMLRSVRSEDELAAVLAHEVGHINHRDGIAAISKSRWTEALTIIGTEAAKTYGSEQVARLTTIFEGSIDDVFKTLVVNGYGRSQEYDADLASLRYLAAAGYDPKAMESFLERLAATEHAATGGILKTHPGTGDRLENVRNNMPAGRVNPAAKQQRDSRFAGFSML